MSPFPIVVYSIRILASFLFCYLFLFFFFFFEPHRTYSSRLFFPGLFLSLVDLSKLFSDFSDFPFFYIWFRFVSFKFSVQLYPRVFFLVSLLFPIYTSTLFSFYGIFVNISNSLIWVCSRSISSLFCFSIFNFNI